MLNENFKREENRIDFWYWFLMCLFSVWNSNKISFIALEFFVEAALNLDNLLVESADFLFQVLFREGATLLIVVWGFYLWAYLVLAVRIL